MARSIVNTKAYPSGRDPIFAAPTASALASVPPNASDLAVIAHLRGHLPVDLARRAAQLHALRERSTARFPAGHLPFLTPQGLEQASSYAVATHRAAEAARHAPASLVWDATSGIGADSIALAQSGLRVVTSDLDPFTLGCADHNLRHHGLPARPLLADATTAPVRADAILIDPDRRPGGRRTLDPALWSPSLAASLDLAGRFGAGCIQLAPGFDPAILDPPGSAPAATEGPCKQPIHMQWTSLRGGLATLDLWCGAWAGAGPGVTREVVALDGNGGSTRFVGEPEHQPALSADEAREITWLSNPDPAVIRSGLLGTLARREQLAPLAPAIAFLGGDHRPVTPLLKPWRVLGSVPLDRKRVRALLRQHDIGPVQVLKRGHPERAEVLAKRFSGSGTRHGWLAIARLEKGHMAFLVEAPAAQ
ncbi:MAG: hypothetical protein ACI8QZ_002227 [Chlamydiales bacterium]